MRISLGLLTLFSFCHLLRAIFEKGYLLYQSKLISYEWKLYGTNGLSDRLLWLRMSQAFKAEEVPEGINQHFRGAQCWGCWSQVNTAPGIMWSSFLPVPIPCETLDTCVCFQPIRFRHIIPWVWHMAPSRNQCLAFFPNCTHK